MAKINLKIQSEDSKLNFEQEILLADVGFIISYLSGSKKQEIVKGQNLIIKPQIAINDTKELINLLERYQPRSNVEKLALFATYLNKKNNDQPFSEDQLKDLFDLSNLKMPENFKRDLSIAVERGVLFKLKDSNTFITTNKTNKELENMLFKQTIDESTIFKKKRVRGLTERAELNDSIKSVPITGSIKGVSIKYRELKSGSERILWVVLYLKTHGIGNVSIKDVEFLSDKLGKVLQSKYFAMYNKTNIDEGKIAKVENKFIITEEGENYISCLSI